MSHEVTMPQLGMAQDAGVIVAWHKKPGDAVASDDVLMEVETDKAVMEVPAGVDGFLAEIRAEAGSEVPIGNVIAVISDSADGHVPQASSEAAPAAAPAVPAAEPVAEIQVAEPKEPAPTRLEASPQSDRILASPKAKFIAHQRGIDLQTLVDQGIRQPFHVADLDLVAAPAAGTDAKAVSSSAIASLSTLNAITDRSAFEALMQMPGLEEVSRSVVFGAFAASSLRQITGDGSGQIVVQCTTIPGETVTLSNPDDRGLSRLEHDDAAAPAGIVVHDLTQSRLAGYRPGTGTGAGLQISISASEAKGLELALAFSEAELSLEDAAAFFDAFLNRIENPIQHIV